MGSYFRNIYQSASSIWVGLNITLKHMFTPSITLQYPDERWQMPERAEEPVIQRYRRLHRLRSVRKSLSGRLHLYRMRKGRSRRGSGPDFQGHQEAAQVLRFDIDMGLCCYCGLCTYPCPTECLVMTPNYESSVYDRTDLIYRYARPWDYEQKPADAEPAQRQ